MTVPHAYRVARELLRRDIIVDYREGSGIRIAPHFYTSNREVLLAMDSIRQILDSGAYRKHSARRTHVT